MVAEELYRIIPHCELRRICRTSPVRAGVDHRYDGPDAVGINRRCAINPVRDIAYVLAKDVRILDITIKRGSRRHIGGSAKTPALQNGLRYFVCGGGDYPLARIRLGRDRVGIPDIVHRRTIAEKRELELMRTTCRRICNARRQLIVFVVQRVKTLLFISVIDKIGLWRWHGDCLGSDRPGTIDIVRRVVTPRRIHFIFQANGISVRSAVNRVRNARRIKGAILGEISVRISNTDLVCAVVNKTSCRLRLTKQALRNRPVNGSFACATTRGSIPFKIWTWRNSERVITDIRCIRRAATSYISVSNAKIKCDMVVLVKCNWTNRRKCHLCLDKLCNANYNNAAATCCTCGIIRATTAAAATQAIGASNSACTATTVTTAANTTLSELLGIRGPISGTRATATRIVNFMPLGVKKNRTRKPGTANTTAI